MMDYGDDGRHDAFDILKVGWDINSFHYSINRTIIRLFVSALHLPLLAWRAGWCSHVHVTPPPPRPPNHPPTPHPPTHPPTHHHPHHHPHPAPTCGQPASPAGCLSPCCRKTLMLRTMAIVHPSQFSFTREWMSWEAGRTHCLPRAAFGSRRALRRRHASAAVGVPCSAPRRSPPPIAVCRPWMKSHTKDVERFAGG